MYEMLYNGKLPIKLFSVNKASTLPHLSPDAKLFYIESGEYDFYLNANKYTRSSGEVVIVSCGQIHSFKRLSKEGIVRVLYIDVDSFRDIVEIEDNLRVEYDHDLILDLFKSMNKDDLFILSKLSLVMRMLSSKMEQSCDAKSVDLASKIMEYMLMKYKEKIVMTDIADMLDMNPKQMMSTFKRITGLTMLKYLTIVRLNASLRELQLNKTILEVALSNGFPDSKSYHKAFKEYFEMTPKEYRASVFGL